MTKQKLEAIRQALQRLEDIGNVTLVDVLCFLAKEKQLISLVKTDNAYTVFDTSGPTVISEIGGALELFKTADLRADVARVGGEDWGLKFFGGLAEGEFTEGPFEIPRPPSAQTAPLMEPVQGEPFTLDPAESARVVEELRESAPPGLRQGQVPART